LDLNRVLQDQEVPDSEDTKELFFVKPFGEREDGFEVLMDFSKQYKGLSPFVNLYVTLCCSCLGWIGGKVPADDALTKLNLASYLQRSIHKNKLGPRAQPADMQILSCILNMRLAQHLSEEKRSELI